MTHKPFSLNEAREVLELDKKRSAGVWIQTDKKSTLPEAKNVIMNETGEVVAWVCCEMPKFLDSLSAGAWRNAKCKQFKVDAAFIAAAPAMASMLATCLHVMAEMRGALEMPQDMADADMMYCLGEFEGFSYKDVQAIARKVCEVVASRNAKALTLYKEMIHD